MMHYIVTLFAIVGLFVNPRRPALSFFIWIATNLWWTTWNFRCGDYPQAVMFSAFTISCVIQWWRLS